MSSISFNNNIQQGSENLEVLKMMDQLQNFKLTTLSGRQFTLLKNDHKDDLDILKKFVEKIFSKSENNLINEDDEEKLINKVIETIEKLPDENLSSKYVKFDAFKIVLKRVPGFKRVPGSKRDSELSFNLNSNKIISKCLEAANALPKELGKHNALKTITKILFDKNYNDTALNVALKAIEFTNSRPNERFFQEMIDGVFTQITNVLRDASVKLAKEGKISLANDAANLIPKEHIRSVALEDVKYYSNKK